MRFSEMDSFSKIFDRVGRMLQNFKQQQSQTVGDNVETVNITSDNSNNKAINQFSGSTSIGGGFLSSGSASITPSPCQPYPLSQNQTLSSQSSLASSLCPSANAAAAASTTGLSPQSYDIMNISPQNITNTTSPLMFSNASHHTSSQHQQTMHFYHQNSPQHQTQNQSSSSHHSHILSMQQQQQNSQQSQQQFSSQHSQHSTGLQNSTNQISFPYSTHYSHAHFNPVHSSSSSTAHSPHPQSSSSNTTHHPYQHPMLVASSSQPLMPATSPHYSYGVLGGTGVGGISNIGSTGVTTGTINNNSVSNSINNIGLSGGTSTTSNSPSSCSAISPAPGHSYSAVQTPESPVGFPRRQLSLTVGQRNYVTGKLHLDLNRKPKTGSQGSIFSNTNDVINQHSLSPRPRPRNLGLSNSHDNMFKQSRDSCNNGNNTTIGIGNTTGPGSGALNSIHHKNGPNDNSSSRQFLSRECLAKLSFNTSTHGLNTKTGHYNPSRPPQNALRDEFSKHNRTIEVNGLKYENINEKDFRKISELGNGSFGQVEKMLHIPSNIEFAVKKMRRSGNQDDNKHIINDLDLLRKCTNFPHIVQCYGYYIMETEVWIFMELMTICFDRLLKRLTERIPEKIVGKIAVATVEALNYLKIELSIIHRDIKPSNILINREGIIKLCDFGISGRLVDSKAHSRSVGCAAYMAPERIQPDPSGTYDVRSDVWSLGITLVEIATGKFPYQGWKSDFELLSKVIQDEPPTLPADGSFSEEFQSFIIDCLKKEYHDRPKYNVLMLHQFFLHYKNDTQVNVADWFNRVYPPAE